VKTAAGSGFEEQLTRLSEVINIWDEELRVQNENCSEKIRNFQKILTEIRLLKEA
jgi:predicted RNase H-like HicB family nuclease